MAIELAGTWVKNVDGAWVNLAHCDLLEVKQRKDKKSWDVLGWNALQPQVEAYIISNRKTEKEAKKELQDLIAKLAGSGE